MVGVLLVALALLVKPGGTLYVKGEGVELRSRVSRGEVLAKLLPGTEVKWLGPDTKDPSWHRVEVGGKKGVVPMSSLTPHKAITEEEAAKPPPLGPPPYAADPAYLALKQLTDLTRAQRANVAAHAKTAGLPVTR